MREGRGTLYRRDHRTYIYVPSKVASDSTFPFPFEKGHVKIIIDEKKKRLIIELMDED